MNGAHFWAGIGGFFLGIAYAELQPLGFSFAVLLAGLGVAIAAFRAGKHTAVVAVMFCAAGVGAARIAVADARAASPLDAYAEERIMLEGRIVGEPDRRETSARLTIQPTEVATIYGSKIDVRRSPRVQVSVPLPATFSYGDVVWVRGVLKRPEAFETDTNRIFDYPSYLAARRIYFEMPFAQVERIEEAGMSVRGALFSIKNAYLSGLQHALPEPHASLAGGITVGDKRSLGENLTEQFRKTGLIHIVVLSGYNITLIVGALMLLVRNMSLAWRFVLGGGIIVAFVLMTGASATGVRAGAMAVIALLAAASFRKYAIDRALALTAAGMVLWNPYVLFHDPGFQLSVIATVGLIHLAPFFERKCLWVPKRFGLRAIAGATLGTQIAVLPLLLYQMGLLSFVSLPANLLVLPAIPAAMIASFAAGLAGSIYGTAGIIAGLPAYALLEYTIRATELFARVPFGAITLPAFSGWVVVAVYGTALAMPWLRRNVFRLRTSSGS